MDGLTGIEKLQKKDIDEAAKVWDEGARMEKPPGEYRIRTIKKFLSKIPCFVHKSNGKIDGLIQFFKERYGFLWRKQAVRMHFICALQPRKGIGKQLIKTLINYAESENINTIFSGVSTIDSRAMAFYMTSLQFEKIGENHTKGGSIIFEIAQTTSGLKKAIS